MKRRLSPITRVLIAVLLAVMFSGGPVAYYGSLFLGRLENRTVDYRFLIRGPEQYTEQVPIVLVLIDNESAMDYGYRSPTPRVLVADLVKQLHSKGARVIGIDVLLDRSYNPEEDAILRDAFKEAGKKVVLVTELVPPSNTGEGKEELTILPEFKKLTTQGFSVSKSEGDDFHRWVNLYPYGHQKPFAWQVYRLYTGRPPEFPPRLHISPEKPWIYLNFPGPPTRLESEYPNFTPIAALEVAFIPSFFFKDKIVLIGSSIEDLGDTFLSSFSTQKNNYRPMFGVEFHAISVGMMLRNDYIYPASPLQKTAYHFLIFMLASLAFLYFRPLWALVCLPLSIIAVSVFSAWTFVKWSVVVDLVYPAVTFVILFIICQWLIRLSERKQSRFLKNTFQHYISPELVEQLVNHQDEVSLGGINRELTLFFSDLADFTSISEMLEPDELMHFLNRYFDEMTQILFEEKGTLDKYIGDAVMAFFGAPNPLADHSYRACRAALRMQEKVDALNEEKGADWMPVTVRVGINSGNVIVGNSGSKTRFNYTVMGDAVNLASRLEGINKLFGSRILISEFTRESVISHMDNNNGGLFTRELGKFVVKGKAKAVSVFELIDFESNITPEKQELKNRYEDALKYFYEKNFWEAEKIFTELKEQKEDKASEFMLSQIQYLRENPPRISWEGEIVLMVK